MKNRNHTTLNKTYQKFSHRYLNARDSLSRLLNKYSNVKTQQSGSSPMSSILQNQSLYPISIANRLVYMHAVQYWQMRKNHFISQLEYQWLELLLFVYLVNNGLKVISSREKSIDFYTKLAFLFFLKFNSGYVYFCNSN